MIVIQGLNETDPVCPRGYVEGMRSRLHISEAGASVFGVNVTIDEAKAYETKTKACETRVYANFLYQDGVRHLFITPFILPGQHIITRQYYAVPFTGRTGIIIPWEHIPVGGLVVHDWCGQTLLSLTEDQKKVLTANLDENRRLAAASSPAMADALQIVNAAKIGRVPRLCILPRPTTTPPGVPKPPPPPAVSPRVQADPLCPQGVGEGIRNKMQVEEVSANPMGITMRVIGVAPCTSPVYVSFQRSNPASPPCLIVSRERPGGSSRQYQIFPPGDGGVAGGIIVPWGEIPAAPVLLVTDRCGKTLLSLPDSQRAALVAAAASPQMVELIKSLQAKMQCATPSPPVLPMEPARPLPETPEDIVPLPGEEAGPSPYPVVTSTKGVPLGLIVGGVVVVGVGIWFFRMGQFVNKWSSDRESARASWKKINDRGTKLGSLDAAFYTCISPTGGDCGVIHRSLRAAKKCCAINNRRDRIRGNVGDQVPVRLRSGSSADRDQAIRTFMAKHGQTWGKW